MLESKFVNGSYSDTKNAPGYIKDTLRLSFKNVSVVKSIYLIYNK